MRPLLAAFLTIPAPAFAHTGHLAGLASRDHRVAQAALGIAIVPGLRAGLKGKRDDEPDDGDAPETKEAEA